MASPKLCPQLPVWERGQEFQFLPIPNQNLYPRQPIIALWQSVGQLNNQLFWWQHLLQLFGSCTNCNELKQTQQSRNNVRLNISKIWFETIASQIMAKLNFKVLLQERSGQPWRLAPASTSPGTLHILTRGASDLRFVLKVTGVK